MPISITRRAAQHVQRLMQSLFAVDVQRRAQRRLLFRQQFFTDGFQRVAAEDVVVNGHYRFGLRLGQRLAQRQLQRRETFIAQLLGELHHARLADAGQLCQLCELRWRACSALFSKNPPACGRFAPVSDTSGECAEGYSLIFPRKPAAILPCRRRKRAVKIFVSSPLK